MINYFSYGQSLRLIIYAKKAKEVTDREERLAKLHGIQKEEK
jgi:NADH dehydrogenase